ncbi:peptidase inhibitor family I36 protein [Micromonospora sp. HK10]|uniref:peptidase inhibitor family I36 protein n=1 Tax=Micromonospora sp. HK10 TaxID=1538294 RepID=UPI0018CE039B|nr:peptidase inhibitor family I36 protein [Micromonospora sp. HK10]
MKVKTVIASAIIVGSGVLLAPGVSSASLTECASNHMCMWKNNNFSGLIGDRNHGDANIQNLPSSVNDEMDSWANRSASYAGCMFADAGGGGDRQTMARNSKDDNVNPANSDEVTSWRTANAC